MVYETVCGLINVCVRNCVTGSSGGRQEEEEAGGHVSRCVCRLCGGM